MEERVAILEANVGHIRSDISDMKVDIRRLNDKIDGMDTKLTAKIDGVNRDLTAKIDGVDVKIDGVNRDLAVKIDGVNKDVNGRVDSVKDAVASLALTMEKSFAALRIGRALDRVWWLLMSGALLGIMARAFKWI